MNDTERIQSLAQYPGRFHRKRTAFLIQPRRVHCLPTAASTLLTADQSVEVTHEGMSALGTCPMC